MIEQMKNVMIAVFTLAALAIITFIILFLHPNVGDEARVIRVRFADIDKLTNGTRVNFGGRPVGEVTSVKEIVGPDGERIEHNGIIYPYELTLAIDSDITVYNTDEITSRTSGLLGEKSVAITPVPVKKGSHRKVLTKETIIYADESGSVESTLKEFKELSDKIEVTLDGFIDVFDTLKREHTWEGVAKSVDHLKSILASLDQPEKINQIIDNVVEGTRHIKDLAVVLNNQDSTVGRLFTTDDFYLRVSSLLSKAEVILNDINHYGLLFNQDNCWKRLRARRLNLMQQLSYPQEFRNFFNDEIDAVVTSLARVGMVIEQADRDCGGKELWQHPEYLKVYGELLRRVAMLEEYLQMYNQQVMDTPVSHTEFIQLGGR